MSLRNELRQPSDWKQSKNYNWTTWYNHMTAGAATIHKAHPDLLIFFSGLGFDTELRPIFADKSIGKSGFGLYEDINFNKTDFAYANKIVLEVHDYDMDGSDDNCTEKQWGLRAKSFEALDNPTPGHPFAYPLVMSEWGFGQSPDQYTATYASCLREYLPAQEVGWMTWVLGGSYYIREGEADKDESWGLLDHEWKDWRCPECITKGLEPMIQATLGGVK